MKSDIHKLDVSVLVESKDNSTLWVKSVERASLKRAHLSELATPKLPVIQIRLLQGEWEQVDFNVFLLAKCDCAFQVPFFSAESRVYVGTGDPQLKLQLSKQPFLPAGLPHSRQHSRL